MSFAIGPSNSTGLVELVRRTPMIAVTKSATATAIPTSLVVVAFGTEHGGRQTE